MTLRVSLSRALGALDAYFDEKKCGGERIHRSCCEKSMNKPLEDVISPAKSIV